MVKAEYLGYKCERLNHGKEYKISTRCSGNRLIVSVRSCRLEYSSLESFLKEWKVRAVYRG